MIRHRAAIAGLAVALVVAIGACSDDDPAPGGTTTTTTAAEGRRPSTSTTASTAPGETTTTAAPPVAGPEALRDRLVPLADVGDGFALDATLGNGAFSGELCEDVTLDQTWDEQASQAMTRGTGDARVLVTQAVLSFPDAEAAEAFVTALREGNDTCLPGGEIQDVDGGDEGLLIVIDSGETSSSAGLVRAGGLVGVFTALYPTADGNPLTPDLLTAAATLLAP